MQDSMNIEQILRTAEVRRFHILRLAVDQSVGEHVYCVAHIARALYLTAWPNRYDRPWRLGWDQRDLMFCAMFHDIEEGLTGDIPSPTKAAAKKMGFDWNDAISQLVPCMPDPTIPTMADVIKLADLIDAWRFVRTYKINPHGAVVCDRLNALVITKADEMNKAERWRDFGDQCPDWLEVARRVMIDITQPVKELIDAPLFRERHVEAVSAGHGEVPATSVSVPD